MRPGSVHADAPRGGAPSGPRTSRDRDDARDAVQRHAAAVDCTCRATAERTASMETMDAALDPSIRRHRLTVDDVERMVESGILGEDATVELLEGELVAVSPQGPAHTSAKAVLAERLRRAFAGDAYVRDQDPLH